jgi:hypothetical protein
MTHPRLNPPNKPTKVGYKDEVRNPNQNLFDMAVYEWKEAHKNYLVRKKR